MPAKISPFNSVSYGWAYGEDGWNVGMDDNLKKFSFLFDSNLTAIVSSVPSAVSGEAYFNTTNSLVYFCVQTGTWESFAPSIWSEFKIKTTGEKYQFNGTELVPTSSEKVLKIVFMGDSLTQESTRNESWASQTTRLLEELLGIKVEAKNVAIGGSDWNSALNTLQHSDGTESQVTAAIDFNPDLVFIALGINDTVYGNTNTPAQVLTYATEIRDTIKAALPDCQIVYAEEVPHDLSKGVSPVSLVNADTLPNSHQTITLKGLSGVRINSSTYLNTAISGGFLTRHQNWGTMTTSLRTLFDGYFSANLWKMARMGCMADSLHIDELGHSLWAWSAISYLATNDISIDGVDFTKLDFSNISSPILNIDLLYTEFTSKSLAGNMPAMYRGYNSFERAEGWMLKRPSAVMSAATVLGDANTPLTVLIENASPGSAIYLANDANNFSDISRSTTADGRHTQTFIPNDLPFFSAWAVAGNYNLYYGVLNSDGSYDCFQKTVNVVQTSFPKGTTALRYVTSNQNFAAGVTPVYISFLGTDHDSIGVGGSSTAFVIPASLNGKKIRLKANLRMSVPVASSNNSSLCFAGIQKNRQPASGNSVASGRGLPASWQNWNSANIVSGTLTMDFNLASAILTATTGDQYEVAVAADVSGGTPSVLANSYTWFEIEVVN